MNYYTGSVQHLLAELERIDLLIRVQVMQARQLHHRDSEFQGLYIPEAEVDELLAKPAGMPNWAAAPSPSSQQDIRTALERYRTEIERCKSESRQRGVTLRFDEICRLFDLTAFDADALLICLAPEIDLRYERLFAYLQDDVTKKRPGVDLVLNLLCPSFETKLAALQRFNANAPLCNFNLLQLFDDPTHPLPPLLGKFIKIDTRVVEYLLGFDELDARLATFTQKIVPEIALAELILPADIQELLERAMRWLGRDAAPASSKHPKGAIFFLQGAYGVGKRSTAAAICRELGIGLLQLDLELLLDDASRNLADIIRLVEREGWLQESALFWSGFDRLLDDDKALLLKVFLRQLEGWKGLTFLAGNRVWQPADTFLDQVFWKIDLPQPGYGGRLQLWNRFLDREVSERQGVDLEAVAGKFRLSGGQIRDAAATAMDLARWSHPSTRRLTDDDLHTACRLQSNRKLAELAQKIKPHYIWDDIVLPADRMQQLQEILHYVRHRARVYDDWGFNRKLALGKGLNVLFAGLSGTGKTMAADIMAGELGLDLYKIDLSSVVSKYIGETEKNLSKIFTEAETSNAILFFDEADALFGKRSEVRDAHDRYANIEISYLLQKMEEYQGVVILATNLRKNMDDAFVRRMHFCVEFPFPDEKSRLRIWDQIWPEETPRSTELDLDLLARQFEITGGNIRNIALAAAFQAASDGQVVTMAHLIHATRREYQKMGKIITDGEWEYGRQ